jgi:putative endonuclease
VRLLAVHNDGLRKDAFTYDGIPWKKVLVIDDLSSSAAYQIEAHLKKMKSKQYLLNLLKYPELVLKLKDKYS